MSLTWSSHSVFLHSIYEYVYMYIRLKYIMHKHIYSNILLMTCGNVPVQITISYSFHSTYCYTLAISLVATLHKLHIFTAIIRCHLHSWCAERCKFLTRPKLLIFSYFLFKFYLSLKLSSTNKMPCEYLKIYMDLVK